MIPTVTVLSLCSEVSACEFCWGLVVVACWHKHGYFLIYFTELLPKEGSICFFLILLKNLGLFRVELRQKGRSKAKCSSFKGSQQGTASQGWAASWVPEPGTLLIAFLRPQAFLAVLQEEAQSIWRAHHFVSDLPMQHQGTHCKNIMVRPSLVNAEIHSRKRMLLAAQ